MSASASGGRTGTYTREIPTLIPTGKRVSADRRAAPLGAPWALLWELRRYLCSFVRHLRAACVCSVILLVHTPGSYSLLILLANTRHEYIDSCQIKVLLPFWRRVPDLSVCAPKVGPFMSACSFVETPQRTRQNVLLLSDVQWHTAGALT